MRRKRGLSECEKQIAACIAEGWSVSMIALAMGWKTNRAVHSAVERIGWKIDGAGTPRERIAAWWSANVPEK